MSVLSISSNNPVLTRSGPDLTGVKDFFLRPSALIRHRSFSGTAAIRFWVVMAELFWTEDDMRPSRSDRGIQGRMADRSTDGLEGEDFLFRPPPLFDDVESIFVAFRLLAFFYE